MCKVCEKLIDTYDAAVKTYLNASQRLTGIIGDDFTRAYRECERFRGACRSKNEELLAHIRSDHSISRARLRSDF